MITVTREFTFEAAHHLPDYEGKCKKCNVCLEDCGMGITKLEDIGGSTDCILCGRCIEACPEGALRFVIGK